MNGKKQHINGVWVVNVTYEHKIYHPSSDLENAKYEIVPALQN